MQLNLRLTDSQTRPYNRLISASVRTPSRDYLDMNLRYPLKYATESFVYNFSKILSTIHRGTGDCASNLIVRLLVHIVESETRRMLEETRNPDLPGFVVCCFPEFGEPC